MVPSVPMVALGVAGNESEIVTCAEFGVVAYVTREGTFDELLSVVRAAARGELLCSPRIAGTLARRVATLAAERQPTLELARLTRREREIVALIQQDLSNKEIAARLGIEVATVKNHVHNLMEKLNTHSRVAVSRLTHSKGRGTRI
jgi:two-component system, NarL family, nitrate/nitrite response regulator NarL